MGTASGMKLQFSDDFNTSCRPPDHFDLTRWIKWKGDVRAESGRGVLTTTPPGDIGLAGIFTREKHGHPGLAGSNGVEVTLEEFTGSKFIRLKRIGELLDRGLLDEELRWGRALNEGRS